MNRLAVGLTIFGLTAACAPSEQNGMEGGVTAEDEQAIRDVFARLDAAYTEGDLTGALEQYTPNVIHLPPGQSAVVGMAEVRARDSAYVTDFDANLSSNVDEIGGRVNYAYARTSYTESWTPKAGGETTSVIGKALAVLERSPTGVWKISHLMWNYDGGR